MSFIDLTSSAYSELSQFGIFAVGALTHDDAESIPVNNGYWYGTGATSSTFTEGNSPSGFNDTDPELAASQLSNLIIEIVGVTDTLSSINIGTGGGDLTISPGVNYFGTAAAITLLLQVKL
jgi:hypothetical protein